MNEELALEIKQYLKKCQDGIENLITMISDDRKALSIMQKVASIE